MDETTANLIESLESLRELRRADNVGLLAWRFVSGADGTGQVPDYTALAPLIEALAESADPIAADLRSMMIRMAMRVATRARANYVRSVVAEFASDLIRAQPSLFFRYDKIADYLAQRTLIAMTPEPPPESRKAELDLVFVDVGYTHIGERVSLPDGRRGIVINPSGQATDGRSSGVMIEADTPDGDDSASMEARSW